ncbi:MAG: hypothetical protein SGPRY_012303, partial [Prymnesium sp.]
VAVVVYQRPLVLPVWDPFRRGLQRARPFRKAFEAVHCVKETGLRLVPRPRGAC